MPCSFIPSCKLILTWEDRNVLLNIIVAAGNAKTPLSRSSCSLTREEKYRHTLRAVGRAVFLIACHLGRLRAEAMTIRDTKAENGGVTEADWARINDLLRESWQSLAKAVKA
jgi:hypothetical protein